MKHISLFAVMAGLILITGCGQMSGGPANNKNEPGYVQGADGTLYDISCLRTNALAIQQGGAQAAAQCGNTALASHSQSRELTSRYYSGAYYYYYYPPTYWNYSYNNGAYNYNNSYNSYFCSYIFGTTWNSSCYSNVFGYQPSYNNYGNSYNSSCYTCIGNNGYGPYCYNSCYSYGSY